MLLSLSLSPLFYLRWKLSCLSHRNVKVSENHGVSGGTDSWVGIRNKLWSPTTPILWLWLFVLCWFSKNRFFFFFWDSCVVLSRKKGPRVCFLPYNSLHAINCHMQFWLWHISLRFFKKIIGHIVLHRVRMCVSCPIIHFVQLIVVCSFDCGM